MLGGKRWKRAAINRTQKSEKSRHLPTNFLITLIKCLKGHKSLGVDHNSLLNHDHHDHRHSSLIRATKNAWKMAVSDRCPPLHSFFLHLHRFLHLHSFLCTSTGSQLSIGKISEWDSVGFFIFSKRRKSSWTFYPREVWTGNIYLFLGKGWNPPVTESIGYPPSKALTDTIFP